jgi:hypothetical protein
MDRAFFYDIKGIFASKKVPQYSKRAIRMLKRFSKNKKYLSILAELDRKHEMLITYLVDRSCPRTTNLIEGYITANLWLNGFVVLKRITDFTNCEGRFKKLNGDCPLFQTIEEYGPIKKIQRNFGVPFSGS